MGCPLSNIPHRFLQQYPEEFGRNLGQNIFRLLKGVNYYRWFSHIELAWRPLYWQYKKSHRAQRYPWHDEKMTHCGMLVERSRFNLVWIPRRMDSWTIICGANFGQSSVTVLLGCQVAISVEHKEVKRTTRGWSSWMVVLHLAHKRRGFLKVCWRTSIKWWKWSELLKKLPRMVLSTLSTVYQGKSSELSNPLQTVWGSAVYPIAQTRRYHAGS